MRRCIAGIGSAAALLVPTGAWSQAIAFPGYIPPTARPALSRWLARHPGWSAMADADCGCDDDLHEIRTLNGEGWPADPGYHPYVVYADLDRDGRKDVVVGVTNDQEHFRVLILPGRAGRRSYLSQPFNRGMMLFYGSPRSDPGRLEVAHYASDEIATFVPTRTHRYRVEWNGCC